MRDFPYNHSLSLANELYTKVITDGGTTIERFWEPLPKDGYFIGIKNRELLFEKGKLNPFHLAAWVNENSSAKYFGIYQNADGSIICDVVIHMTDKGDSIATGISEKQESIWDITNNIIITL